MAISLNIDGTVYQHASKIEEVTLRQWVDIMSLEQLEDDVDVQVSFKAFAGFSGIPIKVLETVNKGELFYHINMVVDMISKVEVTEIELPKYITVEGEKYYVNQDIDSAKTSQYIDCTHYMNKMNSSPSFYPYMLAIYCLKEGEAYREGYDFFKRAEAMLDVNVLDALRVNAFFLTTSKDYLNDSLRYLGGN